MDLVACVLPFLAYPSRCVTCTWSAWSSKEQQGNRNLKREQYFWHYPKVSTKLMDSLLRRDCINTSRGTEIFLMKKRSIPNPGREAGHTRTCARQLTVSDTSNNICLPSS